MRTAAVLTCLASFICVVPRCAAASAAVHQPAGMHLITAKTIDFDALTGELIRFSLNDSLVMIDDAEGIEVHVPAADVVRLELAEQSWPSTQPGSSAKPRSIDPDDVHIVLANGDRIVGKPVSFAGERIIFDSSIGMVEVHLARIRVWTQTAGHHPLNAMPDESMAAQLDRQDALSTDDFVYLINGDELSGLVISFDDAGLSLDTDDGVRRIGYGEIERALIGADQAEREGIRAVVRFDDGQRITATRLAWDGKGCKASIPASGQPIDLPTSRIARVDIVGGRWQPLSQLSPISFEHTAGLSLAWPWRANRNVFGEPIRVAGKRYEHGIGVHSQSSITFDLEGKYSQLVTFMGLDDSAGVYADVDVEIRVDGKLSYSRDGIKPGTLEGPIRLPIQSAKRVKLTVLFGANADLGDRFNWVESAVIR